MTPELFGTLGGVFVAGLSMGVTSCLVHCSPVMFYIGGTAKGWREGFHSVLAFSVARLVSITALGALAGAIGGYLMTYLADGVVILWLRRAAALFVILLGVFILLGRSSKIDAIRICRALSNNALKKSAASMALLGFMVGITPFCPVFFGVLNYIAFGLENAGLGALYAFVFGLGSALITPLLAIGPLVGGTSKLFTSPKRLKAFRRVSGAVLLLLGASLGLAT
ncbi:MAG: sulfite exporter TauE/SafE family protein [Spirochaetaceae bacterium]